MFGLFGGNKVKKLKKQYALKMEKGVFAQRNGNIALYAELMSEADKILKEIETLEKENEEAKKT